MSAPDLIVEHITADRGETRVLQDVSLRVLAGTTTALLGPSGCGKTTLLRLVAGLEHPLAGVVRLNDRVLSGRAQFVSPELRRVGMVFQDGALFPHMTVSDNVAYGLSKDEIKSGRVAEALEMVDMAGFGDRRPGTLSGGQAQRVAVARALAPRPEVLLLDEPFSGLDAELRVRVRADLVALLRRLEITSIFVTHDQEEAFVVGDSVAVMNEGRIIQHGSPTVIYGEPETAWLAGFVGDVNLLPASSHHEGAETSIGVLPTRVPLSGDGLVMVRPEYLAIASGGDATVSAVEFYGHDTSYTVVGHDGPLLVRELRSPRFSVGDRVSVTYTGAPAVAFAD